MINKGSEGAVATWAAFVLGAALLGPVAGCGSDSAAPTPAGGRSPFSYDEDEIDPDAVKAAAEQARKASRRAR